MLVVPGRAEGASPEPITTVLSDVLRLSPGKWKTRNTLLGVTRDLVRRVYEHKLKVVPSFTSRYDVNRLVWYEVYDDPVTAITREKDIKKWRRDWKIRLIEEDNPDWTDLYPRITK